MTVVSGTRVGFAQQARWQASVAHAGILAALLAGLVSMWLVLALVVALLVHPAPTMSTLERDGARGVPSLVRHGTASLVAAVAGRSLTEEGR